MLRRFAVGALMLAASPAFCVEEIPLDAEEGPVFGEFPSQFYEVASFPSLASPSLPNMIGPVLTPQIVRPLSPRLFPAVPHQPLLRSLLPYPSVLHRVVASAPAAFMAAQSLSLSPEAGPGGIMKAYTRARNRFDHGSLSPVGSDGVEIPNAPSAPARRSRRKRRRSSRAAAKNLDPNDIERFLSRLNAGRLYTHYDELGAIFQAEALGDDFDAFWGALEKYRPELFLPVGNGKKLYVGLGTVDRGPWDAQIRQVMRLIAFPIEDRKMAEGVAQLVAIRPEAMRDSNGFDVLYWNVLVKFAWQVAHADQISSAPHERTELQRPHPLFTDNVYYDGTQGWSEGIAPEDKQALEGMIDHYLRSDALYQGRFGPHGKTALEALREFLVKVPEGPSLPSVQPTLHRPPAPGSRDILRQVALPLVRRSRSPRIAAGDPVRIREGVHLFSLPELPGFGAVHSLKSEARRLIRQGGLAGLTEAIGILTHAHGMMHALSEFGLDQNATRAQEALHGEILLLLQNVHWALARAQLRSHVDNALDAPRQETMGYERLEDLRGALDGLYASESAEGMHLSRSFDARMAKALEMLLVQLMYESMMDRLSVSRKSGSEEYQAGRGAHIVFLVEILQTLALGGFDLAESGSIFLDHAGERRDHAQGAHSPERLHHDFEQVEDPVHPLLESHLGGYSSHGPNGHLFN